MLRIGLTGAAGHIGSRVLKEALGRGHQVTAIVRSPGKISLTDPRLTVITGDVFKPGDWADQVRGLDVLVNATAPSPKPGESFPEGAANLVELVRKEGIGRLFYVGGAGSLEVAPGVRLVDSGMIPDSWKWLVLAHIEALNVLRESDVVWTYFSPAGEINPGNKTGNYRLGETSLITGADGKSSISTEDYADALVNELEAGHYLRRQFTIGY